MYLTLYVHVHVYPGTSYIYRTLQLVALQLTLGTRTWQVSVHDEPQLPWLQTAIISHRPRGSHPMHVQHLSNRQHLHVHAWLPEGAYLLYQFCCIIKHFLLFLFLKMSAGSIVHLVPLLIYTYINDRWWREGRREGRREGE